MRETQVAALLEHLLWLNFIFKRKWKYRTKARTYPKIPTL